MKEKYLCILSLFFFFNELYGQQVQHRIVFDYTKGDTASFSAMMRQLTNITKAAQNSKLEIVCYGPGLDLLTKEKTTVEKQIEEFSAKFNVVFSACEASMQRRGIKKDQLIPQAMTVPLASLQISKKQQEGWSYMKAGY